MSTTKWGFGKTKPRRIDSFDGRGHQIFPAVAATAGRVYTSWLDFRNDASGVFQESIDEEPIVDGEPWVPRPLQRHTADMRAEADAARRPAFEPSQQVSRYIFGRPQEDPLTLHPLQWNVVAARNFGQMMFPFNGDYGAIAAEFLVPADPINHPGKWFNGEPGAPSFTPVYYYSWNDTRTTANRRRTHHPTSTPL